ncbi:hypothetical protein OHA72_10210 [Dactylosporangium sp. NBC_01737]|uniref:hypothetical protein n=1 Tax=Dactylosporangium sp. NBC_01737 TaxID=2975959 RepID=UPI002E0DD1DA|nr:hypothetical protein OHA72_10210 [Dactylosporangium sp. NBC_01737]
MCDVLWDEVQQWFDPVENGSAPDVIVADTTVADWGRLLGLVQSRGWACRYEVGDRVLPVPKRAAQLFARGVDGELPLLRVWPDRDLEWIVRPWAAEEILSDVSLYEIQGQDRLDVFCQFLRTLGSALGKKVLVYSEGDNTYPPMMVYEVTDDRVVFLAGPWS